MYYIKQGPDGDMRVPPYPAGLVWDVDDTLVDSVVQAGAHRGQYLHDVSRILTAHSIGVELENDYLRTLSPAESQNSFVTAEEPSTAGSLANLLHRAGILDSPAVDPESELLQRFVDMRQAEHLKVIKRWAGLRPGARTALRFGLTTDYGQAIATTAPSEEFDEIYDKFELHEFVGVGHVWTYDRTHNTKPHHEPFLRAAKSLIPAEISSFQEHAIIRRMWAIDDSPHGLQSARDAGLFTVGLASREPVEKLIELDQVDVVIDSLRSIAELADAIRRRELELTPVPAVAT